MVSVMTALTATVTVISVILVRRNRKSREVEGRYNELLAARSEWERQSLEDGEILCRPDKGVAYRRSKLNSAGDPYWVEFPEFAQDGTFDWHCDGSGRRLNTGTVNN